MEFLNQIVDILNIVGQNANIYKILKIQSM